MVWVETGRREAQICKAAADEYVLSFFESANGAVPARLNVTYLLLIFAQNSFVRNGEQGMWNRVQLYFATFGSQQLKTKNTHCFRSCHLITGRGIQTEKISFSLMFTFATNQLPVRFTNMRHNKDADISENFLPVSHAHLNTDTFPSYCHCISVL